MRSIVPFVLLAAPLASAAEPDIAAHLARPVVGVRQPVHEVVTFAEERVPRMPALKSADEWQKFADRTRKDVLDKVVLRGAARDWQAAELKTEYLETIPGGPGYKIKKLRYEAVPGFFVPALLYEPDGLTGKVPVVLNVNGHDSTGKAAEYKQMRCINQAKRGMLALNVEWIGMGQLRGPGFGHASLNQLDLCGTSGVAVHFLAQTRGLDVLLAHPHADSKRVAVTGLSGGAWQTIFVSSLDTRVTLTNPVAGYSSFLTRARHPKDLGDSEQTPCDLATVADYAHLTAMMAPRPTLLTFNAADNCCFEAGYAMPPLLRAAEPAFRAYGKPASLRSHVNHDPGTHNYQRDNREAHYRVLGDFFYPGDTDYSADEIPSDNELRARADLDVPLPADNQSFNSLAKAIAEELPRDGAIPSGEKAFETWRDGKREKLREVVRVREHDITADPAGADVDGDLTVAYWRLRVGESWTVPAVELSRGEPTKSAVLLADGGREAATAEAERLLADGYRVLAIDPLFFGEADPVWPAGEKREPTFGNSWLYALLVGAVGERPLGIQASQVVAAANWIKADRGGHPVTIVAIGPRTGLIGLVATAVADKSIAGVTLTDPPASLKQAITEDRPYSKTPEVFCLGLLEIVDVRQLAGMIAPRSVELRSANAAATDAFAGLENVTEKR